MIQNIDCLIEYYQSKGIIIDTDIMLVYIVGSCDLDYISQFKRTDKYCAEDHKVISYVISCFSKKVVTPHILAELSNLSLQARKEEREDYFNIFMELLKRTTEDYIGKDIVLSFPLFPIIGVTDLGIIEAAKKSSYLVFTNDKYLVGQARKKGVSVLRLNDIRTAQWGMK